ncbi:MAG: hypothetical protein ACLRPW_05130 [Intestinibacter sp.]
MYNMNSEIQKEDNNTDQVITDVTDSKIKINNKKIATHPESRNYICRVNNDKEMHKIY